MALRGDLLGMSDLPVNMARDVRMGKARILRSGKWPVNR